MTLVTAVSKCELIVNLKAAPLTDSIYPRKLVIRWRFRETPTIEAELSGQGLSHSGQWITQMYNVANTQKQPLPSWLVPIISDELQRVRELFKMEGL